MTNHVAIVSLRAAQDRIAVDCDLNATVGCLIFRDHQECGRGAPLARSFLSRFSWRGRAGADWHGLRIRDKKLRASGAPRPHS